MKRRILRYFIAVVACFICCLTLSNLQAQTIASGEIKTGTIAAGQTNSYTFSGSVGDSVQLRVGSTNFSPRIDLYGPDGKLVVSAFTANSGFRDALLSTQLTNSGTFTAVVGSYYAGGAGSYGLRFARIPGSILVPAGDEGGPMTNGARYTGQIDLGDIDLWNFTGSAGSSLQLRVGATNFSPRIDLYAPDGKLITSAFTANSGYRDAALLIQLTNTGTFTVVVSSYYLNDSGPYSVTLAQAPGGFVISPGDEGGTLTNGVLQTGSTPLGDLDMWSFAANAGDNVQLRMGATNFSPRIDLYGPDGKLVASAFTANSGYRDAALSLQLTNGGTFTVVLSSFYLNGSGTYSITLAQVPEAFVISTGDEGGSLVNGVLQTGSITLGDLDMWTFAANRGDNVQLRMGATGFSPRLDLYGPDGALIESAFTANFGYRDAALGLQLTNTGTFTVVASAYYLNTDGDYTLSLAKVPGVFTVSPGDEGGTLTNGVTQPGTITVGDLDAWVFAANSGDSIQLRMGGPDFSPRLDLYGPDGTLVASAFTANSGYRDATLALRVTNSGTFTVLASGYYLNTGGAYNLTLARAPGELTISPGDEGGVMTNGFRYVGTNSVGDLDAWTFYGTVGDSNVFRISTTNFTPWLRLYGPSGSLVAEAFVANSGNRSNFISYVVTNAGTYTLVSSAYYLNQSGTYGLKQSRVPPDLILPGDQIIDEGVTLDVPVSAADPDDPTKSLTFLLVSGPPGASLSTLGPTNASITWPTTEGTGPSTNLIVASVTDVVNGKSFTRTNNFTVVVNEVNTSPVLPVPTDRVINELAPLIVTNTATDADIPANSLSYALLNPPTGAAIDTNGVITWTPTEAQGPSTNVIVTVVTDSNPWAVNSQHLSATNSFTVVVNELNTPPSLPVQSDRTIAELSSLVVTNTAADGDLPVNALSYILLNPPPGASIDGNGVITWTPTEAQGPTTNLIVTVATDNNPWAINAQHLSVTNSFTVVVNELNSTPVLPTIVDQTVNELTPLTVTNTASDSDFPANPLSYTLINPPAGVSIDSNGIVRWTPAENQGPSTNQIVVVVTDTNAYAINARSLSATNSFKVVVNEVNSSPVLPVVGAQTINELATLMVTNSATDSDIPANSVIYSLLNAPTGATIDSNGVITWTPSEIQGPSTNVIVTVVTDSNPWTTNSPHLSATNSFTVVVNEVNSAPLLPVIGLQTVNELGTLIVTNTATDTDSPANSLGYSLLSAPNGVQIDGNGVITWTPSETQGPSTNVVITVVTDNNPWAVNGQHLSATNSFTVVVSEVNLKPILQPIGDASIHYGLLLSIQAVASDPDIPTNTLTFSLDAAPTNMAINASSGLITWTPALAQIGTSLVTVRVTDNGQAPLSDTTTFHVTVTGSQPQLTLQPLPGRLVQLNINGDVGTTYQLQISTNLVNWDNSVPITITTSPYPYIDPGSSTAPTRFYRLKVGSP